MRPDASARRCAGDAVASAVAAAAGAGAAGFEAWLGETLVYALTRTWPPLVRGVRGYANSYRAGPSGYPTLAAVARRVLTSGPAGAAPESGEAGVYTEADPGDGRTPTLPSAAPEWAGYVMRLLEAGEAAAARRAQSRKDSETRARVRRMMKEVPDGQG